ncbi:MAG: twin-arginine translocase TatA/TatE family subunit [Dehalococcoidia bacterium]|nr:twin-arginine translocase TatA/TatE family subunit [Dehalococcoidia bacterium]
MPFRIGATEIIVILAIALLIFGIGKLPQAGSALGKTMKAFRTGHVEDDFEDDDDNDEEEIKPRSKALRKGTKH